MYQVICTIIEGNGKPSHPTSREEAAVSRNYPYLRNSRLDSKHTETDSKFLDSYSPPTMNQLGNQRSHYPQLKRN